MRYIISVSAAALMFANASCDVAVNEEVKVNEDVVVEDAVDNSNCACNGFNSVYLGLGIGGSFLRHSIPNIEKITGDDPADPDYTYGTRSPKANRVMGTLVAGAGKTFNDHFYFGGDAMLDVMKSKKKSYEYKPTLDNGLYPDDRTITFKDQITHKGFSWNAGARFGYVSDSGVLTYLKAGVAFDKAKATHYAKSSVANTRLVNATLGTDYSAIESASNSKVAPMVAIGVEKVMSNGLSGRVEVEYDFKARKHEFKRKGGIKARLVLAKHFGF